MLDRLYIMDGLGKADMKSRQGLTRLSKMVKNIRKVVTDRFTVSSTDLICWKITFL